MAFLTRWFFAFALVALTFNPTEYNYARWALDYGSENLSIAVLLGLVLLIGYIIYLRATMRSIGKSGMLLVAAVIIALGWVLIDLGVLHLNSSDFKVWLGLFGLSLVLGIGMSWSHVRRAMTGQTDVDDVDD